MNKVGYMYIAENASFLYGLLKIGVTWQNPETRIDQLTRSTSVPGQFSEVYSIAVSNTLKAESRAHLLLKEYRVDTKKEFFRISKYEAILVLKRVASLLDYAPNSDIFLHNNFYSRRFNKKVSGRRHSLFLMTLIYSHTNSVLDKLQGFPPDVTDGFLDVEAIQQYHRTQASHIRRLLKTFAIFAQDLTVSVNNEEPFKVYNDVRYGKGQLCWSFTPAMKEQFMS